MDLGVRQVGELAPELLDVGALLAVKYAGPHRVHGHVAFLVRALDHALGDARLLTRLEDMLAHLQVFVEKARIFASRGVPARIPGAVDAEPKPDRIDLLSH